MKPIASDYGVRADCPDCHAVSFFVWRDAGREYGYVLIDTPHRFEGTMYSRIQWRMLKCSWCGSGALAKFHDNGRLPAVLESFHPRAVVAAALPGKVPEGIVNEYREAELCASVEAWRPQSRSFARRWRRRFRQTDTREARCQPRLMRLPPME